MDLHYFIAGIYSLIPFIAIIGAVTLPIAGLVFRKSKKQASKKLLIAGVICLGAVFYFLLLSIIGAIFCGTLGV